MRIRHVRTDGGSSGGDCAALFATDTAPIAYRLGTRPGYLVQGVTLSNEEHAVADETADAVDARLGPHEARVWVPADVIDGPTSS